MEDKKIVALYVQRNTDAIQQSAERYGSYCRAIARNILQNEQDEEECVNDALLSAWNSIPPNRPENLGAYLGKLTRGKAIDRWRSLRREKRGGGSTVTLALEEIAEVIPAKDEPEQALLHKELRRAIHRFLDSLGDTERNVFLCRYWYFEDIDGICARFEFSRSKVESMLHRTRQKLKRFLQQEELI